MDTIKQQQSRHLGGGKWKHVNEGKGKAKSARVTTNLTTTAATNNTLIVIDLTDSASAPTHSISDSASASASAPTHSTQLESDVLDLCVDGADTLQAGDTLYFRRSFFDYKRSLKIRRIVKYTMLYEPFGTNRDQKCEIEHIVYFDTASDEKWVTTRLETSPGRRFQKVGTVHNVPLSMYNFIACEERNSWDDDQNWR